MKHTDYLAATKAAYNSLAHAKLYMQRDEHRLAFAGIKDALDELSEALALATQTTVVQEAVAALDGQVDAMFEEL